MFHDDDSIKKLDELARLSSRSEQRLEAYLEALPIPDSVQQQMWDYYAEYKKVTVNFISSLKEAQMTRELFQVN